MITPRTRLLVWFAILVVPFATVGGIIAEAVPFAVVAIGLFVLLVIVDASLAGQSARAVEIDLPPLVRATLDRPFSIRVRVQNPPLRARRVRVALAFPAGITPSMEEISVALPADTEWSTFDWQCSPIARGRFVVEGVRIEGTSPLGFWAFWRTLPARCEIRVYPNLARERHNLAALFLHRGSFGAHAQRQVGRGRDFEKLREYIPGDSVEDVHWKATAKRSHPVTKVYQIERTQEIYVIVDASRLSGRKITSLTFHAAQPDARKSNLEATSLERFITAALVLGLAAEQQGDLFGLLTFSDRIETFIRARSGKAHYHACRDALYTLQPRDVAPDFDELSTFVRLRLRRRALLLFLTSLDDPVSAESFVRSIELLCRQHLVLVNMVQPPGVRPIFSDENVDTANDLYGELAGHLRWQQLRELEKVLQRRGVRLSLLPSERLAAGLVSQYVNVKQRQML